MAVIPDNLPVASRKRVGRAPSPRLSHYVYVIELARDVLSEPRFRKRNTQYVEG